MKKIFFLFQFLPLSVFLWVARSKGFSNEGWVLGFKVGAVLALIETFILLWAHVPLNRLLLGANVYLILGAIGSIFGIEMIIRFCSELKESAVFISICVVGILSTAFSSLGFIEVQRPNRSETVRYSAYLLGVVAICLAASTIYRGDPLKAGTLPFLGLIVGRYILQRRLTRIALTAC